MQTQNVNVNVFVIIGKGDVPLFEVDLSGQGKRPDSPHLAQFVIHAALDIVDELVWYNNNMYLKQVDRFNDLLVSSWVTPGHIRFMLLHTQKNDEAIASFFKDVYELYVKVVFILLLLLFIFFYYYFFFFIKLLLLNLVLLNYLLNKFNIYLL
eukprot:GHVR01164796.1.p1 GENE.GHVR01164796.1~~GHVR01164796.1.p1  ORF type:complete len:153 (+),score=32.60 GHVR01164796.1:103-561(+)